MGSRASGKVILLGEHAVVYDQPALAAPLGRGATATSCPGSGRLRVPAWDTSFSAFGDERPIARAWRALLAELPPVPDLDVEATFSIPTGAGLGSSAALAAAVACELVDASGDSDGVRASRTARAHIDAIGRLVERGAEAALAGDLDALGAAMDENQQHLEALDVSCDEIARACALARAAGARGAKLTGGGGGGCVVALPAASPDPILAAWRRAGLTGFAVTVEVAA
jgi:mevalonate kinase